MTGERALEGAIERAVKMADQSSDVNMTNETGNQEWDNFDDWDDWDNWDDGK